MIHLSKNTEHRLPGEPSELFSLFVAKWGDFFGLLLYKGRTFYGQD